MSSPVTDDDDTPRGMDAAGRRAVCNDVYSKLAKLELDQEDCPALVLLRAVLEDYAGTDRPPQKPLRGEIPFPEARKVIVYRLPLRADGTARVVLEHQHGLMPTMCSTSPPPLLPSCHRPDQCIHTPEPEPPQVLEA